MKNSKNFDLGEKMSSTIEMYTDLDYAIERYLVLEDGDKKLIGLAFLYRFKNLLTKIKYDIEDIVKYYGVDCKDYKFAEILGTAVTLDLVDKKFAKFMVVNSRSKFFRLSNRVTIPVEDVMEFFVKNRGLFEAYLEFMKAFYVERMSYSNPNDWR